MAENYDEIKRYEISLPSMSSPLKVFVNPLWEQWQASMNIRFKNDKGQSKRAKPYCRSKSIPVLFEKMHRTLSSQKNTMLTKEKKQIWKALIELKNIKNLFYQIENAGINVINSWLKEVYTPTNVEESN